MDPSTGTFTSMDTYGGSLSDPMSLHKYMFANSNPVMYSDPSGHRAFSLDDLALSMGMGAIIGAAIASLDYTICALITDPGFENHNLFGLAEAVISGWTIGLILATGFYLLGLIPGLSVMFWAIVGFSLGLYSGLDSIAKGIIDKLYGNSKYGTYEIVMGIVIVVISSVSFGIACKSIGAQSAASEKPEVKTIDPNKIRYSQSSTNGSEEITESMIKNGWVGDPIDVVEMPDGVYTTVDNTRVQSARNAGIDVKAVVHPYDEPLPQEYIDRFTTKKGVPTTWGEAVELRIGKQKVSFRNSNPLGGWNLDN